MSSHNIVINGEDTLDDIKSNLVRVLKLDSKIPKDKLEIQYLDDSGNYKSLNQGSLQTLSSNTKIRFGIMYKLEYETEDKSGKIDLVDKPGQIYLDYSIINNIQSVKNEIINNLNIKDIDLSTVDLTISRMGYARGYGLMDFDSTNIHLLLTHTDTIYVSIKIVTIVQFQEKHRQIKENLNMYLDEFERVLNASRTQDNILFLIYKILLKCYIYYYLYYKIFISGYGYYSSVPPSESQSSSIEYIETKKPTIFDKVQIIFNDDAINLIRQKLSMDDGTVDDGLSENNIIKNTIKTIITSMEIFIEEYNIINKYSIILNDNAISYDVFIETFEALDISGDNRARRNLEAAVIKQAVNSISKNRNIYTTIDFLKNYGHNMLDYNSLKFLDSIKDMGRNSLNKFN